MDRSRDPDKVASFNGASMANIPDYIDGATPEQEAVATRIRARRGGRLLNLDRVLLHSAPFADGWNQFMPKVRNDLAPPLRIRELIICAVAKLNGAAYEFHHHAPILAQAGATAAQIAALDDIDAALADGGVFSAEEAAVLRFTLESTRQVQVQAETMSALRQAFPDPRHVLEIVGVAAAYNMVSRVLVALDVRAETD